jgi:hypothetical protein
MRRSPRTIICSSGSQRIIPTDRLFQLIAASIFGGGLRTASTVVLSTTVEPYARRHGNTATRATRDDPKPASSELSFADPGRAPNYSKTYTTDQFDDTAIASELLTVLHDVDGHTGQPTLKVIAEESRR